MVQKPNCASDKKNSAWYKKSRRRTLADMHIEAWDRSFLSEYDSDAYFELLKKAHVQGVMIYTNSHVGYCNWPSKSGCQHPAFSKRDKVGEVIHKCHEAGIDVIAYYSLVFNNWAYDTHPEWRMITADGKNSCDTSRYGLCCPNNEEYHLFIKAQIEELCEHYRFEGVFFDMAFWPLICRCDSCQDKWKKETGKEIPAVINWHDPDWVAFQRAREKWIGELAQFATDEIKKIVPEVSVEHQCSSAACGWVRGVTENLSNASDYAGGDLYGGFGHQSFVCKLFYAMTKNQPFEFMTSRCKPDLRDHTTTKNREEMARHNYLTLAHHGAFLFIDAIDPRGTLNPEVYEIMGDIFREGEPFEAYLSGDMVSDMGIYFSLTAKLAGAGERDMPCEGAPSDDTIGHLNASINMSRMLKEENILHNVITYEKLKVYPRNKLLCICDIAQMTKEEEEAVIAFVNEGGRLYITGSGTTGLTKEFFGARTLGMTEEAVTYMVPSKEEKSLLAGINERYPLTFLQAQERIVCDKPVTVAATIALPYTNPKNTSKFASIHSNPPGIFTEEPAMVYASYGKGKVVWAAAPIENHNTDRHREVIAAVTREFGVEKPSLRTNAPADIELTLFNDKALNRFIVHAVNVREDLSAVPIFNVSVSVKLDNLSPAKLFRVADGEEIQFTEENGYACFTIDRIDMYEMHILDCAAK